MGRKIMDFALLLWTEDDSGLLVTGLLSITTTLNEPCHGHVCSNVLHWFPINLKNH